MFKNKTDVSVYKYYELKKVFSNLFSKPLEELISDCIDDMEKKDFSFISRLPNGLLFRQMINEREYKFISLTTVLDQNIEEPN